MTEERVGIIAETFWNKLRITNLPDASEIRYLIRTVATEAREEGIDEIRDVMLPLLVFQDKKVIEEQAERLKKEKP